MEQLQSIGHSRGPRRKQSREPLATGCKRFLTSGCDLCDMTRGTRHAGPARAGIALRKHGCHSRRDPLHRHAGGA
ncbi:hypothetical protein Ga0080574_TMP2132 [Salipiger abyssi]|uniref:Uncharacterized protein n=1 Tax=Salipiger abyssi TaxID=1250539 RepID=A0A1P8UT00_9RHOB|nr:hypothetical protein Ga0080574_TMP2132 [Salipiger abyssi]